MPFVCFHFVVALLKLSVTSPLEVVDSKDCYMMKKTMTSTAGITRRLFLFRPCESGDKPVKVTFAEIPRVGLCSVRKPSRSVCWSFSFTRSFFPLPVLMELKPELEQLLLPSNLTKVCLISVDLLRGGSPDSASSHSPTQSEEFH